MRILTSLLTNLYRKRDIYASLEMICSFAGGKACTKATNCPRVPMESRNAASKAVHAAVQRGSEQMWYNGAGCAGIDQGTA